MASFTQIRRAILTAWEKPVFDESCMTYLCGQQEKCPTTGTLHWQVYVELTSGRRLNFFKEKFGHAVHVEPVGRNNGAHKYCLKDETCADPESRFEFGTLKATGGNAVTFESIQACSTWDDVLKLEKIGTKLQWAREVFQRKPVAVECVEELYEWQQQEVDNIITQGDRKVRVIVDPKGGIGKTKLAQYMVMKMGAFYCTGGKTSDIMFAYDNEPIVVFDLARCNSQEFWPYQAIEFFKNGFGFSPKYGSMTKKFKPCKVIVFCNEEPDKSKLSADRWDIKEMSSLFN